jgi:cytochrome c553
MQRPVILILSLVTLLLSFTVWAQPPAEAPASPALLEQFEKSVRPLLVEKCLSCHGETKQFGGLRLDSRPAILKGGDKGAAIVVGDPDHSKLLEAVRQTGSLKMPPNGKLSNREIESLTEWVKQGAVWSRNSPKGKTWEERMTDQRRTLWSLKPLRKPQLPTVKNRAWVKNPVDLYILEGLERRGLQPALPANRTALIRRATFDLIGLPPTPEETQAFLKDRDPNAYEKLIERLLASPHYGERWGRQWLDVARYSDTLGYLVGLNGRRYPYAYTYRDYVTRALNSDKPYNQFILEQIAADQIPLKDRRDLSALGFITVGNRYLGDTQEIIDDRIDVVCRGLQGLSSGCARCHEHKFDPIPTEDYYSLYSIFNNSVEPESLPQIEEPTNKAAFAEYQKQLQAMEARMAEAKKQKKEDQVDNIRRDILDFKATHPGAPACAMILNDRDKPTPQKVFKRGVASALGADTPPRFLLAVAGDQRRNFSKGSGRLELAQAIASPENPLTARVMVNRIWMGHFGRGIVRTPSDFGTRGDTPSHPALLDWLAAKFMKSEAQGAWSIKKMHRLVMLSSTYRQSAEADPKTLRADPENRLLGRMNRRRLDFEQMRDALLSVGGTLDTTLYGQPVEGVEKSRRRTLYTFLDRQSLPTLWRSFDFPDPNQHAPQRSNTTVPQQSLFLLNNPFVQEMAKSLARRKEITETTDTRNRVARMLALTYSRPPQQEEIQLGMRFLARIQKTPLSVEDAYFSAWQYGYGEYDAKAGKLTSFTPLPKFAGASWQGGDTLPDKALGWVTLNAGGGHPGNAKHAAIRRWTAPRDMVVSIKSRVEHPSPNGDGILAIVWHSRLGRLEAKVVAHGGVDLGVGQVAMKKGETLDFVADSQQNETSDSFAWAPILTQIGGDKGPAGASAEWNATPEFSGPITKPQPLSAWEVYAQALLLTNAFLYVD